MKASATPSTSMAMKRTVKALSIDCAEETMLSSQSMVRRWPLLILQLQLMEKSSMLKAIDVTSMETCYDLRAFLTKSGNACKERKNSNACNIWLTTSTTTPWTPNLKMSFEPNTPAVKTHFN